MSIGIVSRETSAGDVSTNTTDRDVRTVAVIDTGKTNAKVALISAEAGAEIDIKTTPTVSLQDGPYPHFDVARLWDFICGALADLNRRHPIDAISLTAHGSAGAWISGDPDGDGLTMPILDYEYIGPDEFAADYDAARPDFSETFTPRLPAGLNLGAQIFWQERRFPAQFNAASAYVNYPQYWAWRLTGVAATEMCSMGAHSDCWNPRKLSWSSMVTRFGWDKKFAPMRSAFDRLGPIRPALAKRLGLAADTVVYCGIHDSSAALLPHLQARKPPFTVVSTGTWVILFAVGGDIEKVDPAKDTLANDTVFGDPLPVGRFMAGREFEILAGQNPREPSPAGIDRVLSEKIMALPTFVPNVGPFPTGKGGWSHPVETLSAGERTAAASLYLALVTAESIHAAGGSSPVIVDGTFVKNALYCRALAAATGFSVEPSATSAGSTLGAALLAMRPGGDGAGDAAAIEPLKHSALADYLSIWRRQANA